MFKRRRVKKVVQIVKIVSAGQVIPMYLLDDGTVVWKLSD